MYWCKTCGINTKLTLNNKYIRTIINNRVLPYNTSEHQEVMVNSNELYEFPRPTLAKVINIGGIGIQYKDAKPLEGEFKKIAESGSGMVVMSFGSVVQAELMPEHWKTAFLNAFAQFPQYEFLIRYASDDLKGI
ncbi:hypothetical protein ANCDUO_10299 [Ancylostoma duodenale]|uniref:glucuronosyltransferase n=1 Tax=Ancylostoma duodenale TaxID=51022 RepID=A0A0C2DAT7_9BILA|nr:hypothetical protein ANCDUO_10299 [Ancylostoma duodenale]